MPTVFFYNYVGSEIVRAILWFLLTVPSNM